MKDLALSGKEVQRHPAMLRDLPGGSDPLRVFSVTELGSFPTVGFPTVGGCRNQILRHSDESILFLLTGNRTDLENKTHFSRTGETHISPAES